MVWLAQENILFLINLRRRKKNQLHNPLIHSTDTASWTKTKSTLQSFFIDPNSAFFTAAMVTPCFLPWASWACAHLLWAVFHSGGVADQSHHHLFLLAYLREGPCRDKLSIMSIIYLCSDTVRRRPSGVSCPSSQAVQQNMSNSYKGQEDKSFHLLKFSEHLGHNNKKMDFQYELLLVFLYDEKKYYYCLHKRPFWVS